MPRWEPRRTKRLRALAKLRFLVKRNAWGLPWSEAAVHLADLVRAYPRIVLRPELWGLVVAQLGGRRVRSVVAKLGGRRVRSALRRLSTRRGQLCPRPSGRAWAQGARPDRATYFATTSRPG